jgi:hypothetical protein
MPESDQTQHALDPRKRANCLLLQHHGKTHAQGAWQDFGNDPFMPQCSDLNCRHTERIPPMKKILKSLSSFRSLPSRAEIERAYLNASVSLIDLERREREIDLGLFRRSSFDV